MDKVNKIKETIAAHSDILDDQVRTDVVKADGSVVKLSELDIVKRKREYAKQLEREILAGYTKAGSTGKGKAAVGKATAGKGKSGKLGGPGLVKSSSKKRSADQAKVGQKKISSKKPAVKDSDAKDAKKTATVNPFVDETDMFDDSIANDDMVLDEQ